jgi:hypothetical protein
MQHIFDIDIAKKYGLEVSIFMKNISFWVKHNQSNDINFNENRYWTYNTQSALTDLFPYWSRDQIKRIIKKSYDLNLLMKGNFNQINYDRTTWFSLTDYGHNLFGLTLGRKCPIESMESPTPLGGIAQPIPDNKPDNKQKIKDKIKAQPKNQVAVVVDLPKWLDKNLWEDFKQFRKEMKKPMTELMQKKMINRLEKMRSEGQNVEDVLNQSMANGWQGVFEVKSTKERSYGNQQSEVKSSAQRFWERNTAGLPEYDRSVRGEREISENTTDLCSSTDFLF